jgi:hypothetical protein
MAGVGRGKRLGHDRGSLATPLGITTYRGMKNLELTDAETVALINALKHAIVADRYPLSPRVGTLVSILNKLRPEPAQEPLPEPKRYEPPAKGRYGRRR